MGNFVKKLVVHSKGAVSVLRDPGVSAKLATHGESMAQRVNGALRTLGNDYVRVHVTDSKGKNRARARVVLTYPVEENVGNLLLGSLR